MKLVTESYLGGQLDFDSTEARGTTFRLALPLLERSENTQH